LRLRFAILWSRWFRAQRRFAIPLSDPQLFTASPAWQQFIAHDPHALHTGTARLLFASAQLDFFLLRACWGVRVPTLLLLAQADRIIDNRATRRYINRFRTPARTVIEYPQAHHTLEFEPEPARFRDDLLHWLHTSERD
jgi:alpha-beta hydrolase superfamily lysophospholipase